MGTTDSIKSALIAELAPTMTSEGFRKTRHGFRSTKDELVYGVEFQTVPRWDPPTILIKMHVVPVRFVKGGGLLGLHSTEVGPLLWGAVTMPHLVRGSEITDMYFPLESEKAAESLGRRLADFFRGRVWNMFSELIAEVRSGTTPYRLE